MIYHLTGYQQNSGKTLTLPVNQKYYLVISYALWFANAAGLSMSRELKVVPILKDGDTEVLNQILDTLSKRPFFAVSFDKERGVYQQHRFNMLPEQAIFCCELAKSQILEDCFE